MTRLQRLSGEQEFFNLPPLWNSTTTAATTSTATTLYWTNASSTSTNAYRDPVWGRFDSLYANRNRVREAQSAYMCAQDGWFRQTAPRDPWAEDRAQAMMERLIREAPPARTQAPRTPSRYEQLEEERAAAIARAETLLLSCLTEEQRTSLLEHNYFIVAGSAGGIYRIRRGRTHNIDRLDMQGNKVEELCVAPQLRVPDADTMLSQKITLETNEGELRRMANIWDEPSRRMIHRAALQLYG